MPLWRQLFAFCFVCITCIWTSSVASAESRTICVYDPAGRSGEYFAIMETFAAEASTWGVTVELKPYIDEATAAKDYQAQKCDGVVATGVRLQRFNNFPSTIEAMGAIPTYSVLKQMLQALATYDSAAADLKSGEHETIGFIPVGAVYLYVRDRNLASIADLNGKRIATMDYDKAAPVLVRRIGAIQVPADLGSIGPLFNNGKVDVCYMTASGYRPFELFRGLEQGGGVIRYPLAQGTLQVLLRHSRFPEGFTTKARKGFVKYFQTAHAGIVKAEQEIESKYWIEVPANVQKDWDDLFLKVRVQLRDKDKAYDGKMLGALRNLRCGEDRTRAECAKKIE